MIVGTVWALLVCASYGFQFGRQLPALHHRLFATTSSISKSNEAKEYIPYDPDLWRKGYADCKEEVCEMLNGTLPKDLVGTYYRYFAVIITILFVYHWANQGVNMVLEMYTESIK